MNHTDENEDHVSNSMFDTGDQDYGSMHGWTPPDPYAKLKEKIRREEIRNTRYNAFDTRPASEWLEYTSEIDPSAQLFGEIWRENDLCILFADTGIGKSILAVQIGDAIARGKKTFSLTNDEAPLDMTAGAQNVLYLDFEMAEVQFSERYSELSPDGRSYISRYDFTGGLSRSQIAWDTGLPEAYQSVGEFIVDSIDQEVAQNGFRLVIVDNLSYLSSGSVGASSALRLMKALKTLKSDRRLSILVLAHTTKRHFASPLTVNELAGSKNLANFADTIFTIGHSHFERDIRYIKQIKMRNLPPIYDASNVIVCRVEKPTNFPRFRFLRFDTEEKYLQSRYDRTGRTRRLSSNRNAIIESVRQLDKSGHTQRQIAAKLDISVATVNRYLKIPDRSSDVRLVRF